MILYYSPLTKQILSDKDLWALFQPVKHRYRFKEFREILGYRPTTLEEIIGRQRKRIDAQNHLISVLLKRMKMMSIRDNVRELVKDHEFQRQGRKRRF